MNASQRSNHLSPNFGEPLLSNLPQAASRRRRPPYRAIAIETTLKLGINVVLSAAAISALVQILPYHLSQQEKLQEIRAEVKVTESRVNRLRTDFSRHFDPQAAKKIMQEQSSRVDPNQLQVVWSNTEDAESLAP